jgi:hypothetical protein
MKKKLSKEAEQALNGIKEKMAEMERLASHLNAMRDTGLWCKGLQDEVVQLQNDYTQLVSAHRTSLLSGMADTLLKSGGLKSKRGRPRKTQNV